MAEIVRPSLEIKRIKLVGPKHISRELLIGSRESDGLPVSQVLPRGITVTEVQRVKLFGAVYHAVIGETPGTDGNWRVSVSQETFRRLLI